MKVKMKAPKKLKTARWVYGIDVSGDEVLVPEHLISEFEKLGFKAINEHKRRSRKPKLMEVEGEEVDTTA